MQVVPQDLVITAHKFITDRNWWQFHNPKNDAMNVLVEISELAEHLTSNTHTQKEQLADELADVLFALIAFRIVVFGEEFGLNQINHKDLSHLISAQQVCLSMMRQAGLLADPFIWCTPEQANQIARQKKEYISYELINILAHLILLGDQLKIDLAHAYQTKMAKNALKYPVNTASGDGYEAIKDAARKIH